MSIVQAEVKSPPAEQRDERRPQLPTPRPQTRRQRAPKRRWVRVVEPIGGPDPEGNPTPGLIEIWVEGEQPTRYVIAPLPVPEEGEAVCAFALTKLPADATQDVVTYNVSLGGQSCGNECDCLGWARWAPRPCRHQAALRRLLELKLLAPLRKAVP